MDLRRTVGDPEGPDPVSNPCSRLRERIRRVLGDLEKAARRSGRDPGGITLVAVTKTVPPEPIREAVDAGLRVFGENRLQEAREKIPALPAGLTWHMVGSLQRNKARLAAGLFQMIHSVDRLSLGEILSEAASQGGKVLPVLVQVNLGKEQRKSGVVPEKLPELVNGLSRLDGIQVRGLMTIPPLVEDPEESRPHFRTLRTLAEAVNRLSLPGVEMRELSMGMSSDFGIAIEEGATIIRVGTAIFGERPEPRAHLGPLDGLRAEGGHGR